MDYQILSGCFIRGDIRGAIDYMERFDEGKALAAPYRDLFENCNYIHYAIPEELDNILLEYQIYFRDVFYCGIADETASSALLSRLRERLGTPSATEEELTQTLEALFARYGYHILTGRTGGRYGPYVWKETVPTEYEVELPDRVSRYRINILRGFVMRSWMAYLTFDEKGTGGWAGRDGIINCIEQAYDFDSERFRVSFLKHEAQHVCDMAKWPDMSPTDLEYRAKLVELMYSQDKMLLPKFISEAVPTRTEDSHAQASVRLSAELASYVGRPITEISNRAKELFALDTQKRA